MTEPATNPYVIRLERLERENAELKATVAEHARILARLAAAFGKSSSDEALLTDEELDADAHNDPVVRKALPAKYWTGESFVGKRLSLCTPEFLVAYAKYKGVCAFMSRKEYAKDPVKNAAKAKYAEYDEKDSARALSWARRIREGWQPPAPPSFGANKSNGAGAKPFGGAPSSFGGSAGGTFGSSSGPFGAPATPPEAPPSEPEPPPESDTSFNFGANANPAPPTEDVPDDDLAPL